MLKTIVYDENQVIGINPTSVCNACLKYDDEDEMDGHLEIQFNNNREMVTIPNVDFAIAHEIIDFLNNPEELLYTVE